MNTYIINKLKQLRSLLSSDEALSSEAIDAITCEFEMMKLEIEQHITNMPQTEKYKHTRSSAENAVQKCSEILELLEEIPYDKELVCEILELIDDIDY